MVSMTLRGTRENVGIVRVDDERVDDERVDDERVDDERVDDERVDNERVDDERVDTDGTSESDCCVPREQQAGEKTKT